MRKTVYNISKSNLCVITDCIHYFNNEKVGNTNYVLTKQFDELFKYFKEVTICCPFSDEQISNQIYNYKNGNNIKFVKLPVLGGQNISDKLRLIFSITHIIAKLHIATKSSQYIYQRFPNNINIPGFFYSHILNKKLFASFTGEWHSKKGAKTYLFQKYLLKYLYRGIVFIYGNNSNQFNLISTFSPSFSYREWDDESKIIDKRIKSLNHNVKKRTTTFINIGRLDKNKNQLKALNLLRDLKSDGYRIKAIFVGEGEMRDQLIEKINIFKMRDDVSLESRLSMNRLRKLYRKSDFVLQTPLYEGYGKIPIEGMMHGCIPILNNVGVSKNFINSGKNGILLSDNWDKDIKKISSLINNKNKRVEMIKNCRDFSKKLTLDSWGINIIRNIARYYRSDI